MPIITTISDTHTKHKSVVWPTILSKEAKIVIHAGDFSFDGSTQDTIDFLDWYMIQPFDHHILIAGNHDWICYKEPNTFRSLCEDRGIIYLEDQLVELEGLRFYGTPWQPIFFNWAYNLSEEDLIKKYSHIPSYIDVLITHCPAKDINDQLPKMGHHVGSTSLAKRMKELTELKLHVCGHIHAAYGYTIIGKTIYVNSAFVNEAYKPCNNNPHIVVL